MSKEDRTFVISSFNAYRRKGHVKAKGETPIYPHGDTTLGELRAESFPKMLEIKGMGPRKATFLHFAFRKAPVPQLEE